KATQQAHGRMVNYLYKLDDIVANHEALAQRGEGIASPAVKSLLNQNDESGRGGNGQQGSRPFAQIMNSTLGGGRK
ncbi:MCD, Malonyl-CoA decarboxylase MCD, partial [Rhizobium ruizarguesonis]